MRVLVPIVLSIAMLTLGPAAAFANSTPDTCDSTNGLAVLVHDDRASGHAFHSELTYRQTDGIPTRLTETVDGQVKRTAEVEQLQLTPR